MPPPNPPTPTQRRPARNEDPFSTDPHATHNHDYSNLPYYSITRGGRPSRYRNYRLGGPRQEYRRRDRPAVPRGYVRQYKNTPPWRMKCSFNKKYRCCQCGSRGDVFDSKLETSDEEPYEDDVDVSEEEPYEDDADVSDEEPGEDDSDESDQYYAPVHVLYYDDLWDLIQDLCEVYFGNYEEDYEDEDEESDGFSESDDPENSDEDGEDDEDDPEMTGTEIKRTAHNPDRAGRCPNQMCRHRWCHKCPIIREDSSEKVLEKPKKGKKRLPN